MEYILVAAFYGFIICQILYIYITRKTKTIVVKQKFIITSWGFSRYIIVDSNGDIYELANVCWFAKLDAINDWIKLKVNKKYKIFCYGITSRNIGTKTQIIDID